MDSLNRAMDLVSRWKTDRKKERAEMVALLESVVLDCQASKGVWQEYLSNPGAPGDQWTLVSWVGPARAKQLHEINLRAKESVEKICRLAGPEAGRFVVLDEDVTEMAYRQLKPDETGPEAAKTAVANLEKRAEYLRELKERLRRPPAPGKAAKVAKKTNKKIPKKAAKPARKKAPPKK